MSIGTDVEIARIRKQGTNEKGGERKQEKENTERNGSLNGKYKERAVEGERE